MRARLTLVSASLRRRHLLAGLNIPFDVAPSHAHERWTGPTPADIAIDNALRKIQLSEFYGHSERVLLGADTIIHHSGQIFGKPAGEESARRMLMSLSGCKHEVITGFYIVGFSKPGVIHRSHSEAVVSTVLFQELTKKTIREYLLTEEWRGKAGAYAIQGKAGEFVLDVSGDYDNIVGLPLGRLKESIGTKFSDYQFL